MDAVSIGIVVVTHNAKKLLQRMLPTLFASKLKPKILILNSSSTDGTIAYAKELGIETLIVPRNRFNHGTSRELARKKLGTEIVIFATPDILLENSDTLSTLVQPLLEKKAALSYARQLPHEGARFAEAFGREFNYPEKSSLRTKEDAHQQGSFATFCSNALAAWDQKALDAIGGFKQVLTGEDTLACAELLQKGYCVYYCAEARIFHSHRYTLFQEFKRSFDTGYARRQNKKFFGSYPKDEKTGWLFAKRLLRKDPLSLFHIAARYLGYKLGKAPLPLPKALLRKISGQDFYWA